jgi:hypothetical protein
LDARAPPSCTPATTTRSGKFRQLKSSPCLARSPTFYRQSSRASSSKKPVLGHRGDPRVRRLALVVDDRESLASWGSETVSHRLHLNRRVPNPIHEFTDHLHRFTRAVGASRIAGELRIRRAAARSRSCADPWRLPAWRWFTDCSLDSFRATSDSS